MAHINLLPWREERRQERQRQFYIAVVAGLILAVVVFYLAMLYVDGLIDEQNSRNNYLQTEITKVDKKIKEIKGLEQERDRLIARMQVIQDLQRSRPKVVKVFDALVRTVPDGIYLTKVSRQGNMLTMQGVAESNARVSVFMRNLDANKEFDEPQLQVVQRTSTSNDAIRNFTLQVRESQPAKEDGDK